MLKLFNIEWMKIKSYKAFWILFGSFVVLFPTTFFFSAYKFMQQFSGKSMEEMMLKNMLGAPFVFPKVWHTAAWMGGLFFMILGLLFIMLITNEVQYRTHRQNIIDGWSRMDFLNAKFSLLISFVAASTVLVFLTAFITGYIHTPKSEIANLFEGSYYIIYFALMAFMYLLLAYAVAIFIKRTGLSIIIYFVIVAMIDNLLWLGLTFKGKQLGYYLPLETVDSLVPNPFKPAMMEQRTVDDWTLILAAVGYTVLFTFLIIRYFKKSDLKT